MKSRATKVVRRLQSMALSCTLVAWQAIAGRAVQAASAQSAAAAAEVTQKHAAAVSTYEQAKANFRATVSEQADRIVCLERELGSSRSEYSAAVSLHAETASKLDSLRSEHYAAVSSQALDLASLHAAQAVEVESVGENYDGQWASSASALRSEMDRLRASHKSALAELGEEHTAALSVQELSRSDLRATAIQQADHVVSLEREIAALRSEHSATKASHAVAVPELASLCAAHAAELEAVRASCDSQRAANESALRSEMDRLCVSHATTFEAASTAADTGLAELREEHSAV